MTRSVQTQQRFDTLIAELIAARDRGEASRVYFIQAGQAGPIKIGRAVDPLARRKELQSGNHETLYILAAWPGGQAAERAAHRAFKGLHIRGEWFRAEGLLAAFVAGLMEKERAA